MDYLSARLFNGVWPGNPGPSSRGETFELMIALRNMQGWWMDAEAERYLPSWFKQLHLKKPDGLIDFRTGRHQSLLEKRRHDGEPVKYDAVQFIREWRDPESSKVLLPPQKAGPDVVYRQLLFFVKTTWTLSSQSTMRIAKEVSDANAKTMDPDHWFSSQPSEDVDKELAGALKEYPNRLCMRFEFPFTAKQYEEDFGCIDADSNVINVDLNSPFASQFFGKGLIERWKEYVQRSVGAE